ncbi:hypothetical protein GR183_20385 [Stappia sp. GBMRC 2046]|uniref:Apple domain-containing protein n=1 Tax=Stappia sediminis TaxID=2692190 RepID=A0A7X3S9V3_9HYPH|nr:hypothetical protein [Stappia sediminis]
MNILGFDAGQADGVFGSRTRRAIIRFQRSIGVRATGRLTAEQIDILYARSDQRLTGNQAGGASSPQRPAGPANTQAPFIVLNNVDLPAGDYRSGVSDPSLRGISAVNCKNLCAADARCSAFTFNLRARVCILKNTVAAQTAFRGAVSGIKVSDGGTAGAGQATAATSGQARYQAFVPTPVNMPPGFRQIAPVKSGERLVTGYPIVYGAQKGGDTRVGRRDMIKPHLDLAMLLDLVIVKNWPGILSDQYVAYEYANRFLTGDLLATYVQGCNRSCSRNVPFDGWRGQNEFEREEAYKAFVADIGPRLAGLAPEMPIKMLHVHEAEVQPYDAAKGEFPIRIIRPANLSGTVRPVANFDLEQKGGVPDAIPLPRDEAELFLSRLPSADRKAFVVVEKTLDIPEKKAASGNAELLLEASHSKLYADPDARELLFDFNAVTKPVAVDPNALAGIAFLDGRPVMVTPGGGGYVYRLDEGSDERLSSWRRAAMRIVFDQNPALLETRELAFDSIWLADKPSRASILSSAGIDPNVIYDSRNAGRPDLLWYRNKIDEFARRAVLSSIREKVPEILARTAPKLPISVKILCSFGLDEYDFKKQVYPVSSRSNVCKTVAFDRGGYGEAVMGSNAKIVVTAPVPVERLKFEIPIPEAQARQFRDNLRAGGARFDTSGAIMGIDAKITGLRSSDEKRGNSNQFELVIEPEDAALYRFDNLTTPVMRLGIEPVPSLDTVSAVPRGSAWLGTDTLGVILGQDGESKGLSLPRLARIRASLEAYPDRIKGMDDAWERFFPDDLVANIGRGYDAPPAQLLENFGQWQKARIANPPKTVTVETINGSAQYFGGKGERSFTAGVFYPPGSSRRRSFEKVSELANVPLERLTGVYANLDGVAGLEGSDLWLSLPAPAESYKIRPEIPQGQRNPSISVNVEMRVVRKQVLWDSGKGYPVFDVEPVGASVLIPDRDNMVIGRAAYDATFSELPSQRKPDDTAQAKQVAVLALPKGQPSSAGACGPGEIVLISSQDQSVLVKSPMKIANLGLEKADANFLDAALRNVAVRNIQLPEKELGAALKTQVVDLVVGSCATYVQGGARMKSLFDGYNIWLLAKDGSVKTLGGKPAANPKAQVAAATPPTASNAAKPEKKVAKPVPPASKVTGESDISGVRLGQGFEEAEKIVRETISVGKVAVLDPEFAKGYSYDMNAPFNNFKAFVRDDGDEYFSLFSNGEGGGDVIGVARTIRVRGAVTQEQILGLLKDKYGEPLSGSTTDSWVWTNHKGAVGKNVNTVASDGHQFSQGVCSARVRMAWKPRTLRVVEGEGTGERLNDKFSSVQAPRIDVVGGATSAGSTSYVYDTSVWDNCGPTVLARIGSHWDGDGLVFAYALIDLKKLAEKYRERMTDTPVPELPKL